MCKLVTLILCYIFMTSICVSALGFLPCYEACLSNLIKTTPCSPIDNHCFCTNEDFLQKIGTCVCQSCSGADIQTSAVMASEACLQAGVSLQFASCASLSSYSGLSPTSVTTITNPSSPTRVAASSAAHMAGLGTAFIVTAANLAVLAL